MASQMSSITQVVPDYHEVQSNLQPTRTIVEVFRPWEDHSPECEFGFSRHGSRTRMFYMPPDENGIPHWGLEMQDMCDGSYIYDAWFTTYSEAHHAYVTETMEDRGILSPLWFMYPHKRDCQSYGCDKEAHSPE
jgi:hypothetical protein